MINSVQVRGRVRDIEEKKYPDGCVITYFKLIFVRTRRTDEYPCRVFRRRDTANFYDMVKNGDILHVEGELTCTGSTSPRMCVDVHRWHVWPEAAFKGRA